MVKLLQSKKETEEKTVMINYNKNDQKCQILAHVAAAVFLHSKLKVALDVRSSLFKDLSSKQENII